MAAAAVCPWPNPERSAAWAFTLPADLEGKNLPDQLKALGGRYLPWKAKDAFVKMYGVPRAVRLFLAVVHLHSYHGVATELSLREIAEDLGCTRRTVQNYIWEAEEKVPGFEVKRIPGLAHTFRFTMKLLVKIEAVFFPKPKVAQPAPPPPSPSRIREAARKVEDLSAQYYRLLNEGKTPEQARAELGIRPQDGGQKKEREPLDSPASMIRAALATLAQLKGILPPRAG